MEHLEELSVIPVRSVEDISDSSLDRIYILNPDIVSLTQFTMALGVETGIHSQFISSDNVECSQVDSEGKKIHHSGAKHELKKILNVLKKIFTIADSIIESDAVKNLAKEHGVNLAIVDTIVNDGKLITNEVDKVIKE